MFLLEILKKCINGPSCVDRLVQWPCRSSCTSWSCEPNHADRLYMHKPYTLQMAHLRLQAVRADQFWKISSEWSSDGPIVVSSSLKHVWHHSGGWWPTSLSEVHWTRVFACEPWGPRISVLVPAPHVLAVWTFSHVFIMPIASHVLVPWATPRVPAMQIVFACIGLTRWWWSIWGSNWGSVRTTSRKLWQIGKLMVPSWPVAHMSLW